MFSLTTLVVAKIYHIRLVADLCYDVFSCCCVEKRHQPACENGDRMHIWHVVTFVLAGWKCKKALIWRPEDNVAVLPLICWVSAWFPTQEDNDNMPNIYFVFLSTGGSVAFHHDNMKRFCGTNHPLCKSQMIIRQEMPKQEFIKWCVLSLPGINRGPGDHQETTGGIALLECYVAGDINSVLWQKNGVTLDIENDQRLSVCNKFLDTSPHLSHLSIRNMICLRGWMSSVSLPAFHPLQEADGYLWLYLSVCL